MWTKIDTAQLNKSFIQDLDIGVLRIYLIFWNFQFLHNVFLSYFSVVKKVLLKNEEKPKNSIG